MNRGEPLRRLHAYAIRQLVCLGAASLACGIVTAESSFRHAAADLTSQALALEHGEGVAKDPLQAAALYCEAARLGDAEAQFNLGWMYANGRGVAADDAIAALFFGMAAQQGLSHAANMLHHVGEAAEQPPECLRNKPVEEPEAAIAAVLPERKSVVDLVLRLAPQYQVNPELALAVIAAESAFSPGARSPKNARGLMQLMPETALRFNVANSYDPAQNVRGGLAYLRWLLAYFEGDVALVAAAYNAGEGVVNRYRGIPPFRETRRYVQSILSIFNKRQHPYDASITGPSPLMARLGPARTF